MTDEFNDGVLYQPYDADQWVTFNTGQVSVDAESTDGALVAFTTPGGPAREHHSDPTTIEIWSVADRTKVYEIKGGDDHLRPIFLANPTRLVCVPRTFREGTGWFAEQVRTYDARTGELSREINLTPDRDDLGLDLLSGRARKKPSMR